MASQALQFNRFEIYSNEIDESIDMRGGTPRIEYRESVFVPYVTLKAAIVDTGNTSSGDDKNTVSMMEFLKCEGGEKVFFAIEDAQGNKIKLTNDDDLMLSEVTTVKQAAKATSFIVTIISKEALTNEISENNCVSRYEGLIAEVVREIIKDNLKSEKGVEVDFTDNMYTQWGDGRNPFKLIMDLQKIAIPYIVDAEGNMAGYLFWQTSEGFHFKSVDRLFEIIGKGIQRSTGKRIKRFISTQKVEKDIPIGYDAKILDYHIIRNTSLLEQLKAGAFGSQSRVRNIVKDTVNKEAPLNQDTPTIRGGKGRVNINPQVDKVTNFYELDQPVGNTFFGSSTIKDQVGTATTTPAFRVEDTVLQALRSYRDKFNISMEIKIEGDFSLHAGDLVYIDIPELSSKKTVVRSPKDSGIYMIADLCHFADKTQTYTGLHLVRDSFGVKSLT